MVTPAFLHLERISVGPDAMLRLCLLALVLSVASGFAPVANSRVVSSVVARSANADIVMAAKKPVK